MGGPNIACVYALLTQVGFKGKIIFSFGYTSSLQHPVRGVFHAFRDEDAFARRFRGRIDNMNTVFDLSDDGVRERVISTIATHLHQWLTRQQQNARPSLTRRLVRALRGG